MKRLLIALLCLLMCFGSAWAEVEAPEVPWTFELSLTDLQSDFVLLVNTEHLLDASFVPSPLTEVKGLKKATSGTIKLQSDCLAALTEMFQAATEVTSYSYTTSSGQTKTAEYKSGTGMVLYVKSGYRSYSTQKTTYSNHLANNNGHDDGYVAKPGASEHQTGLCVDILNYAYTQKPKMTQDFKWTAEAQWMKEHCCEFGFILRYPEDKEAETGIKFEPWHFRYVGVNAANYIMQNGLCLEEFYDITQSAIEDFLARGGDIQEQLDYEYSVQNALPVVYIENPEESDPEIDLIF